MKSFRVVVFVLLCSLSFTANAFNAFILKSEQSKWLISFLTQKGYKDLTNKTISDSDCRSLGILIVDQESDYNRYKKRCKKAVVGYMMNPSLLSLEIVKDDPDLKSILRSASIVPQISLALRFAKKNNIYGGVSVLCSSDIECYLSKSYVNKKKNNGINIKIYEATDKKKLISIMRGVLSKEHSVIVVGSNDGLFDDFIKEVMFKGSFHRKSMVIGGSKEDVLDFGYAAGLYVDKNSADELLKKAINNGNISILKVDLGSDSPLVYAVVKLNKAVLDALGYKF